MNNKVIAKKIRDFRLKANISQLELEVLSGLSVGTISRIENGVINPTKETLLKIGTALKLSPKEKASLFGIEMELDYKSAI